MNEIVRLSDPLTESIGNLLVVMFPKSTSKNYPLALNIAEGAAHYDAKVINGILINYAVFSKAREQAGRAQVLLDYISEWKGVQVFVNGHQEKDLFKVTRVLICYLKASGCNDWRAHCFKVIDDPLRQEADNRGLGITIRVTDKPPLPKMAVEIDQYVFPCSLIYHYKVFQANHPASFEDQIQAEAVKYDASWCPFFDATNFKKSGIRYMQKEFFT
ncbi:MAG: hypothetical protein WCS28_12440 [Thiomicrospira sp.]